VAAEPLFRRFGQRPVAYMLVAMVMIGYALVAWSYKQEVARGIPKLGPRTAEVLAQFRALNPRVPPAAKVVFMEDPWPYSFDMAFIAELWFRDRKIQVKLNQQAPLRPEELAAADAVFTWRDGRLIRLR
jgi:hypothetical protein